MKIEALKPTKPRCYRNPQTGEPLDMVVNPVGVPCFDCHRRATWSIAFGPRRPQVKLCDRCAGYLAGVLTNRIEERRT